MKKTRRLSLPPSAEVIARVAEEGKDVSRYFTNRGRMMSPLALDQHYLAKGARQKAG